MTICINEFDTVLSCESLTCSTVEEYPVCKNKGNQVLSFLTFWVHIEIESTFCQDLE